MATDRYFGTYARFETRSKRDAGPLMGADNLVGDQYSIVFQTQDGITQAWMKNRFGALTGFFDAETSRRLRLLHVRGWEIVALLSFVAYTDRPEPGRYWGEAALIAYDPAIKEPMERFVRNIGNLMGEGVRPAIDLGEQGVKEILASDGSWLPKERVPMPKQEAGTVIMKRRLKMGDKLIEQSRAGNKGCLAAGWLFIVLLIVGAIWGAVSVYSCVAG